MKFKGKIVEVLPLFTGTGTKGDICKQGYILEYESGIYTKQIAFDVYGQDRIRKFAIALGDELVCDIDFKVAKGRYGGVFNNVNCWNVTRTEQVQDQHFVQNQCTDNCSTDKNQHSYTSEEKVEQTDPIQQEQYDKCYAQQNDLPF